MLTDFWDIPCRAGARLKQLDGIPMPGYYPIIQPLMDNFSQRILVSFYSTDQLTYVRKLHEFDTGMCLCIFIVKIEQSCLLNIYALSDAV